MEGLLTRLVHGVGAPSAWQGGQGCVLSSRKPIAVVMPDADRRGASGSGRLRVIVCALRLSGSVRSRVSFLNPFSAKRSVFFVLCTTSKLKLGSAHSTVQIRRVEVVSNCEAVPHCGAPPRRHRALPAALVMRSKSRPFFDDHSPFASSLVLIHNISLCLSKTLP